MLYKLLIVFIIYVIKEAITTNCSKPGRSCLDCNTLQICDNNSQLKFKVTCNSQYPGKPYCNPITQNCESNRNVCNNIGSSFTCPGVGLYPDVTNCKRYYECPKAGVEGTLDVCLYQSVYNSAKNTCITGSTCYSVIGDCAGKYKVIPYKPDPTKYVICQGKDAPLLKDCVYKYLIFNANTLRCEFKCPKEGTFKNPSDDSSYYMCVYNGRFVESYKFTCATNEIFDEEYGTCILISATSSSSSTTSSKTTSSIENNNEQTTAKLNEINTEKFTQNSGDSSISSVQTNPVTTVEAATTKESTKNPNTDITSSDSTDTVTEKVTQNPNSEPMTTDVETTTK